MAYEDEVLGLQQQQETARKIRENAQMPSGQMAGGWYVPPSNMQYLAEALKQFTGAYQGRKAREEEKALRAKHEADIESVIGGMGKDISPEQYAAALRVDPKIAEGLMAYEKANKPEVEKIPTGTRMNDQGQLESMPMAGYGDYANYQMQLYGEKARQPGYGEPERLKIAQEGQNIQKANLALSQQAAARQEASAVESRKQSVPPTHKMIYGENETTLKSIDNAIKKIEKNPSALGLQNIVGENLSQRLDKKGVPVRAAVSEIGSKKVHDLSGASVPASESKNLMPFIPTVTDDSDVALDKLNNMKRYYEDMNKQLEGMYSNPNEFKNPIAPKPRGSIGGGASDGWSVEEVK
jgi:hypothetical protein